MNYRYQRPDLDHEPSAAVIEHVFRNWITTPAVIEQASFCRDLTAPRNLLDRLVDAGYLSKYPLWGYRKYYRLGRKAVYRWQMPRSRMRALGPQRLPYELAVLNFMTREARLRLLPHELKRRVPDFPDCLMHWAYFWDDSEQAVGMLRVEPRLSPNRLLEKLGSQLHHYTEDPHGPMRALTDNKQLFLVVIPATQAQKLALEDQLNDDGFPVPVEIAQEEPDLLHFM